MYGFHSLYHCSHSLSLIIIRCHSLSLVVPLAVTRCHSLSFVFICCHLWSLVPLVVTRCHSLSLFVIRCHSLYHLLSLVAIRCHSLSLVVTRCTTRLSFYKRSSEKGKYTNESIMLRMFYLYLSDEQSAFEDYRK